MTSREDDPKIKVAIIIPVYNTPDRFLREALESCFNQENSFQIRVFLFNDGSTETGTLQTISEFQSKYDPSYVFAISFYI